MGEQVVRRRVGLLEAEVDGEIVGLQIEQGNCYGFNQTATFVWKMIEQPTHKTKLRDSLLREFDVDPATCEAQLDALIAELEARGLVEVEAVGSARD